MGEDGAAFLNLPAAVAARGDRVPNNPSRNPAGHKRKPHDAAPRCNRPAFPGLERTPENKPSATRLCEPGAAGFYNPASVLALGRVRAGPAFLEPTMPSTAVAAVRAHVDVLNLVLTVGTLVAVRTCEHDRTSVFLFSL
jgi:hypothetical protein